jgi:hypothetical protein
MRIGRWIISREHPSERALRKWGQLSPDLRELIARVVRSTAKDAVQETMENNGWAFNADGSPFTAWQRQAAGLPTAGQFDAAMIAIETARRDIAEGHLTPEEAAVTAQMMRNARGLLGLPPTANNKCRRHDAGCSPDCRYGCHDPEHEHFTVLVKSAKPPQQEDPCES